MMTANWKVLAAAMATVGTMGAGHGQAAFKFFDNSSADGEYTTATNWNTDTLPTVGDVAIIDGGRTALFNGTLTNGAIVVGGPANFGGTNPGGAGALDVQSGTLTAQGDNILIGFNDGDGLIVVSGGTLAHTGDGIFAVGFAGAGRIGNLAITATGTVNHNSEFYVGANGANGVATIDGTLTNGGNFYVGLNGGSSGSVTQSNGTVTIASTATIGLRLADAAGTTGAYSLNGGTLIIPNLSIGAGTGTFTLGGGTLQANNSFASAAPIAIAAAANGIVNTAGNDVTLSGPITGAAAAGFFKQGGGTLTLSGNNTFGGTLVVEGGTLKLGSSTALGAASNAFVNAGAILDPNGQNVSSPTPFNVVLNGAGAQLFNSGGTSTISSAVIISSNDTAVGGNGDLVLNNAVTDQGNNFAFNKVGPNTVTVNSAFATNGAANVLGGTLLLNGTSSGTGQFNVAAGATLGGNGTIASSGVVAAGNVAPGASAGAIGTLTVTAGVDLNGLLLTDLTGAGSGASDLLAVGGLLDIGGSTLNLNVLSGLDDPAYVIATYGSLAGGAFSGVNNLPAGYMIDYQYLGNSIAITAAAPVPEPTAIAMVGVAAIGLLGRRRRAR